MALTLLLLGNWGSRQDVDSLGPFPHQLWGPLFTTKLPGRKGRPEGPWQAAGPRRARVPRSQDAPSGTSPASLRGARAVTPVVALSAALCRSRERPACTARGGPAGPRGPVRHTLSTPSQPTLPFPLGRARSCHTRAQEDGISLAPKVASSPKVTPHASGSGKREAEVCRVQTIFCNIQTSPLKSLETDRKSRRPHGELPNTLPQASGWHRTSPRCVVRPGSGLGATRSTRIRPLWGFIRSRFYVVGVESCENVPRVRTRATISTARTRAVPARCGTPSRWPRPPPLSAPAALPPLGSGLALRGAI